MKSESKPKKSLIGGFCGGLTGCLAGILCQSDWLAMILFFVVGYIGYDFKEFFTVLLRIIKKCFVELKDGIKSLWQGIEPFFPYPILHVAIIPIVFILFFALGNDGVHLNKQFFENALDYFSANWVWIFTGHNPMYPASEQSNAFIRTMTVFVAVPGSLVVGCFFSFITSWLLKGIVWCIKNSPFALCWCFKNYFKAPVLLCLIIIYATFGPIIYFFKALGLIAIGIHSYRRMACGISTLAGGIVYMMCVPFAIEGISPGIQAIFFALGCGLACGLLAAGVDLALDGEKVKNKLDAFIKLSIYKTIPTKIKF